MAPLDELRPERPHRPVLLDAVAERRNDRNRPSVTTGSERHRLAVVPARRSNDAGNARLRPEEIVHVDEPAPDLEGADGRVVLVLHPHLGPTALVQQRPTLLRRRRHRSVDDRCRGFELGNSRHPLAIVSRPGYPDRSMRLLATPPSPLVVRCTIAIAAGARAFWIRPKGF